MRVSASGFGFRVLALGSFRKLGVPYFGVLIIRILLLSVLYQGTLFSELPQNHLGVLGVKAGLRGCEFGLGGLQVRVTSEGFMVQGLGFRKLDRRPFLQRIQSAE